MGHFRRAFTAKEKLAAVAYAEAHGNRAAGREFTIDESCIRQWRKQKSRLQAMPRKKQADRGSAEKFAQIEEKVLEFVLERRRCGKSVSTSEIRVHAIKVAKSMKIKDFKASADWCYAFMRRKNLSIRRRTHISQKLPEDFDDKLLQFQKFVIKQRKIHDYDLSQIGNADQTPLRFDLPPTTTVAPKGSKTVSINTTSHEKDRFTVMLACTADGGKLPPYVIFKRKTLPKGVQWPRGVIVRCQSHGWMDQELTIDWIKSVWGKRPGALREKSLLVLDAFRCHKSDYVKTLLKDDYRSTLTIIPGGMTSILQPLDVSINKPMKDMLRRRWNDWYCDGEHTYTASGNMRKPSLLDVCTWINDAWQELDPAIIVRSFKKCCISNAMDGTEDDVLWEDLAQKRDDEPVNSATNVADESDDDDFIDDPYYADCRQRDLNNEFMTDEQVDELLQSDDEDFDGFDE